MSQSVLHFANLRLGAAFASLGIRGRDVRAELVATLAHIGDIATSRQITAVVVSGDLFGCAVPAAVTLKAVQAFFTGLKDAHIPAVILPGARDPEGAFDRTFQPDSQDYCPGAFVLGPDTACVSLPTEEIDVYSVLLTSGASGVVTTRVPVLTAAPRLAIGVGYWSGRSAPDLAAMAEAAAAIGIRYVGVGGSSPFDFGTGNGSVACSPGVPEPVDWDHADGTVALVQFDDEGNCRVERLPTGTLRFVRRELNMSTGSKSGVDELLTDMSDARLGLELVLTGACPPGASINPAAIETEFGDRFFNLRVVDRTELQTGAGGAVSAPQGTVLGNFAQIMEGRISASADAEEADLQREACRLAIHLLQGTQT